MTKLIEALSAIAGAHQILENEPMSVERLQKMID